jgi:signal transduction histidine kinase
MTADVLDKLFKTNENTNRKGTAQEGGTGLGLILTKELTELNGGKIVVASEVGKGTTFSLRFKP